MTHLQVVAQPYHSKRADESVTCEEFTFLVQIRKGHEFLIDEETAGSTQSLFYASVIQSFIFSSAKKANAFIDSNPLEGNDHYHVQEWLVDEFCPDED